MYSVHRQCCSSTLYPSKGTSKTILLIKAQPEGAALPAPSRLLSFLKVGCQRHAFPDMISSFPFSSTHSCTKPLIAMSRQTYIPLAPRPGRPWIDISSIRNALNNNHFIDLLSELTPHHSYSPDTALPHYNPAGSYSVRMQKLSAEYRRQVAFAFARALPPNSVSPILSGTQDPSSTLDAIAKRAPLIVGAVLADQNLALRARVPLLIRSDIAHQLFPDIISPHLAEYIPVAVKRRPLEKNGHVIGRKCLKSAQVELWLWNRLLASTLDTDVECSLIVGLNPRRKRPIALGAVIPSGDGDAAVGEGAIFDTDTWAVARVPVTEHHGIIAMEALRWRVDVIDKGEQWIAEAETAGGGNGLMGLAKIGRDMRMRPNMKCASMYDWPWAHAKKSIAIQLRELTLVSGVSEKVAANAMRRGLPNDYSHDCITAESLDVDSHLTDVILRKCKPSYQGPLVTPALLPHNRSNWRGLQSFNPSNIQQFDKNDPKLPHVAERSFYVDFELASPEYLHSEFLASEGNEEPGFRELSLYPSRPIQEDASPESLIFMIGCGQVINGVWQHKVFIADGITRIDESAIVREWLEHMDSVRQRDFGMPILLVWGPEHQLLKKAFKRMTNEEREAVTNIRHYKLVNMLQVVKTGCFSVKGALKNSIKTVAAALEKLEAYDDFEGRPAVNSVQDGADAMALALDAVEHMKMNGLSILAEAPNMKLIASYNEADCRDIARIVKYLREHH